MVRNGATGFVLVFIVLALLTELRLAFWVSLGIPISFLGAFMVMPVLDVTRELRLHVRVHPGPGDRRRRRDHRRGEHLPASGGPWRQAAERHRRGAGDRNAGRVRGPDDRSPRSRRCSSFRDRSGKVARFVPLVVVPCLVFSLVECLAILPAHLAHTGTPRAGRVAAVSETDRGRAQRTRAQRVSPGPGVCAPLALSRARRRRRNAGCHGRDRAERPGRVPLLSRARSRADHRCGHLARRHARCRDVGRGGQARGGGAAAPSRRAGTDRTGRLSPRLCGRRGPANGGRGSRDRRLPRIPRLPTSGR